MTPESIARVQTSFERLAGQAVALSGRLYQELFTAAPALVIRNLHDVEALQQPLRDLGAQHVGWGARPNDYRAAREALVAAVRSQSANWNDTLERDWRAAITEIVVPMLQGAAVETALAAERLSAEG